jgi:hypothetical protein
MSPDGLSSGVAVCRRPRRLISVQNPIVRAEDFMQAAL